MLLKSKFLQAIFLWILPILIPLELLALFWGNPNKNSISPYVVSGSIFYVAYIGSLLVFWLKKPDLSGAALRRLSLPIQVATVIGIILFGALLVVPFWRK